LSSILAVVGIAGLILEAGNSAVLSSIPGVAPVLVAISVVLIIGVVVGRGITELIVGMLGVGMLALSVGVSGAIGLAVLVALMLWLLGVVRGLFA